MHSELPQLTDGVVELRVLTVEDAPALIAEQDDLVVRWLTGRQLTLTEAGEWIDGVRESWIVGRHRRNFAVIEVATGRLVGGIEAHTDWNLVDGIEPGEANLGYWIGPSGRRKGHAVRSVTLVARYLGSSGVARALIRTRHDNAPANRVAERAGFTRAAVSVSGDPLARWYRDLAALAPPASAT